MSNSSCVLYVGAIPYNWDVEVIKSVVCGSGPIVDVRCMMDNASKNKGFCFVEYLSPLDALNALTILSKLKIEGRKKLRIELSKEGLRNSVHLSKPVLKLNRLLLPANVVLPLEMKENVQGIGLDDDESNANSTPNTISMKDQDMELDEDIRQLKKSILNNSDIRTMVSQMLANGMDLHQIASLITQFNAKNDANNNNNNNNNNSTNPNNSIPNNNNSSANNTMNSLNNMGMNMNPMMAMNGMNTLNPMNMNPMMNMNGGLNMGMNNMNSNNMGMNNFNKTNSNSNNSNNNLGGNRLLNASNFLPAPTPSIQSALQGNAINNINSSSKQSIPDPVSKTLSTIPPGVLVELLAKLKLVLSTPQPSANTYAEAAAILNENPKLAVAAAQALLLMGVIDLDVISQANNIPNGNTSNNNISTQQNNNNINLNGSDNVAVSQPLSNNTNAAIVGNIPQEWLALPQHTVAKLLQLNINEANLIFQVLQLSPDQIALLPINERNMANQIRVQYL